MGLQKWRGMGLYLLLANSLVLAIFGAISVGPAWAAHHGQGTSGTWIATAQRCSKSCDLVGSFTPAGSNVPSVIDASIGTGSRSSAVGDSEPAIEVSGHIYPAGGGYDWFWSAASLLVGACGLPLCLWFAIRRYRRRRLAANGGVKSVLVSDRSLFGNTSTLTPVQKITLGMALVSLITVAVLGVRT